LAVGHVFGHFFGPFFLSFQGFKMYDTYFFLFVSKCPL
jgi:hypothetical protein